MHIICEYLRSVGSNIGPIFLVLRQNNPISLTPIVEVEEGGCPQNIGFLVGANYYGKNSPFLPKIKNFFFLQNF